MAVDLTYKYSVFTSLSSNLWTKRKFLCVQFLFQYTSVIFRGKNFLPNSIEKLELPKCVDSCIFHSFHYLPRFLPNSVQKIWIHIYLTCPSQVTAEFITQTPPSSHERSILILYFVFWNSIWYRISVRMKSFHEI